MWQGRGKARVQGTAFWWGWTSCQWECVAGGVVVASIASLPRIQFSRDLQLTSSTPRSAAKILAWGAPNRELSGSEGDEAREKFQVNCSVCFPPFYTQRSEILLEFSPESKVSEYPPKSDIPLEFSPKSKVSEYSSNKFLKIFTSITFLSTWCYGGDRHCKKSSVEEESKVQ